jgi:hypothetical protein
VRYLEVRRHSMRARPDEDRAKIGEHLIQPGVDLARRVGDTIGPFDRVVTTSPLRAYETAIAMGFAVDEVFDSFYSMGDDVDKEVAWDAGFAAFANAYRLDGATTRFARHLAENWRNIALSLPDGGAALYISHGGIIEAGTVAAVPDADFASFGPYIKYCEGVRLAFDGDKFVSVEVLRVTASAGPA